MTNDDFLKEKQNIREKMLKYSRAIKEGRAYEDHYELNESDRILKSRINRKKRPKFTDFDEEYEKKPKKQSSIYLKEDLINVKLEEKKPFSIKLNFFKKNKQKANKNINSKKPIAKEKSVNPNEKLENKSFQFEQISKIVTKSNAYVSLKIQNIKENQKQKAKLKQEIKEKKKLEKEKLQKQEQLEKEKLEKLKQIQEEVRLQEQKAQEQLEYNIEDKYELLDSIKTEENKNLSLRHLSYAGVILIFALLVFFPQIYIRNQIYYISRDIADLRSQEWVLDEENKELQRQLEAIYFQNQVLDYLD
ncbi:hypothetical protein [Campylobacter volucris]|uniref:hypothetical protein n=1 Tax=Campylobacter volucris TaxID=1031542 RepID=UPI000580165A|nr:hypothetical protein [Campylobacter volucris]AJC94453.1 putative membrane protein [Campylobacter volucris LMG 24379]QEL08670.1 putative membrane protein [Campylobacter volucris]